MSSERNIKKITSAQIINCTFKKSFCHSTGSEVRDYNRKLHLSMLLSNHYESTVKIVFNTVEGYKEVIASIWGATEKLIYLRGGMIIPFESVAYVSL